LAVSDELVVLDDLLKFQERLIWDRSCPAAELFDKAKDFTSRAGLIDAYRITSLCRTIEGLANGKEVAEEIINEWVEAFKAKNLKAFNDENFFSQEVHPLIQTEIDVINANAKTTMTMLVACENIVMDGSWGPEEEMAMNTPPVCEFESNIKTIKYEELRLFMKWMLKMTAQPENYQPQFSDAIKRFVEACNNISRDPELYRLGALIKKVFTQKNLQHLIEPSTSSSNQVQSLVPVVKTLPAPE
jgi:hypothetical protein